MIALLAANVHGDAMAARLLYGPADDGRSARRSKTEKSDANQVDVECRQTRSGCAGARRVSPQDLDGVYRTGAIYWTYDVEFGVRCESCGRPVAESEWEWQPADDSPFVEDMMPPRWCRECAPVNEDAAKGFP
jgi:hypothetical protein